MHSYFNEDYLNWWSELDNITFNVFGVPKNLLGKSQESFLKWSDFISKDDQFNFPSDKHKKFHEWEIEKINDFIKKLEKQFAEGE